MSAEQEIRVGQIWRRKKTGKLIRITEAHVWNLGPSDDFSWRGHDYKGYGRSLGTYIRNNCDLVEDAT